MSDELLLLGEEEEGSILLETDTLIPVSGSGKKHDFHDIDQHVHQHGAAGKSGLLPPIPEQEDGSMELLHEVEEEEEEVYQEKSPDLDDDDGHPHFQPRRFLRGMEDDFVLPAYARSVDESFDGSQSDTAQLFRELLQMAPTGAQVAFSNGTDSHQYLFQHFDALEYEEAASVRPKFIGHYLLGDCLGEGSYAKVVLFLYSLFNILKYFILLIHSFSIVI